MNRFDKVFLIIVLITIIYCCNVFNVFEKEVDKSWKKDYCDIIQVEKDSYFYVVGKCSRFVKSYIEPKGRVCWVKDCNIVFLEPMTTALWVNILLDLLKVLYLK